jgi:hypothetical protein
VKPQRKASPGIVEEDFSSSEDEEGDDGNEEIEEVSPRRVSRMKIASNAFVLSSKVEIKENIKKLTC